MRAEESDAVGVPLALAVVLGKRVELQLVVGLSEAEKSAAVAQ